MQLATFPIAVALITVCTSLHAQQAAPTVWLRQEADRDQYLAGRSIVISAPVGGDVVMAGRSLAVHSEIQGDVTAAGETLTLDGRVGDDVRAAGRVITLDAPIGGHVVAAGAEVVIDSGASIEDWAWITGGDLRIRGRVGDELRARGDNIVVSGEVLGDARLAGERIALEQGAVIHGNLLWSSAFEPTISPGATVEGQVIQEEEPAARGDAGGGNWLGSIFVTVSALVAMIVLLLLFPYFSQALAARIRERPLLTLALGLGLAIVMPIIVAAVFVTGVGFILGIAALASYLLAVLLAGLLGVIAIGLLALQITGKEPTRLSARLAAIIGALIVIALLMRIPLLGGLLALAVWSYGLGAAAAELWRRYRGGEPAPLTSG